MRGRTLQAPALADAARPRARGGGPRAGRRRARRCSSRAASRAELAFLRDAARAAYAAAERMQALAARASPVDYPDHALARGARARRAPDRRRFRRAPVPGRRSAASTRTRARRRCTPRCSSSSRARWPPSSRPRRQRRGRARADAGLQRVRPARGRERLARHGPRRRRAGACWPAAACAAACTGRAPDLERLVDGDVPATTDFRSLYAGLERDWLGLEPSVSAPPLELVR